MKYEYTYVRTDIVAENIDEYIIPECQPACKKLWSKNIMTFMCSNYNELDDTKYILICSELSDENKKILEKLLKENPDNYYFSKYRNAYGIRVNGNNLEDVSKMLETLTSPFEMQDIYEGKMTREKFLMDIVGLEKYQENPEFEKFIQENQGPKMSDYENLVEFIDALDKYEELKPSPFIRTLDLEKVTKSFEEYLEEYGYKDLYDQENNIIYQSEFYKKAHLNYIEFKKKKLTFGEKEEAESLTDSKKEEHKINPIASNELMENKINGRPRQLPYSDERIEEGVTSINSYELEDEEQPTNSEKND